MSSGDNSLYSNRDRLLGEIHATTKSTDDKVTAVKQWCEKHELEDEERFKEVNRKLLLGAVAIIMVAFFSGVLGQLIGQLKIGI